MPYKFKPFKARTETPEKHKFILEQAFEADFTYGGAGIAFSHDHDAHGLVLQADYTIGRYMTEAELVGLEFHSRRDILSTDEVLEKLREIKEANSNLDEPMIWVGHSREPQDRPDFVREIVWFLDDGSIQVGSQFLIPFEKLTEIHNRAAKRIK